MIVHEEHEMPPIVGMTDALSNSPDLRYVLISPDVEGISAAIKIKHARIILRSCTLLHLSSPTVPAAIPSRLW